MIPKALPPAGATLLLSLTAALLLLRLGAMPLAGPDEPRYARVAVEMHRSGEWVRPTLQGEPWLEKPALYYWLAGAAFSLLGETETAARLPSVAACLCLVAVTALVGARLYGGRAGLHAGFVLGTSLLAFAYGRAASMDMLVAAGVTTAIGLMALRTLGIAGRLAVPAAWAAMALATLAKGPLGVLLPLLVLAGYAALARDGSPLEEAASWRGVGLFLALTGAWYVPILLDQGRHFVDVFLLDHNIQRFTSTAHRHPGRFHYYLPVLLGGLFPWSGLLVPGLAGVAPRRSRTDLFVLLWLLLPLAFFSVAGSKLPGYVLPCLPPLALLAGRAAADMAEGRWIAWTLRPAALLGLALGALVAAAPLLLHFRLGDPGWNAALPLGAWALLVMLLASRSFRAAPATAPGLLRVGAAGFLVLLALVAPPLVARHESGRGLFQAARGREVLVWGAWRTAWMAGYFYNDARVREVSGVEAIREAASRHAVLVLSDPRGRRSLEADPALAVDTLALGPRGNALLEVKGGAR